MWYESLQSYCMRSPIYAIHFAYSSQPQSGNNAVISATSHDLHNITEVRCSASSPNNLWVLLHCDYGLQHWILFKPMPVPKPEGGERHECKTWRLPENKTFEECSTDACH